MWNYSYKKKISIDIYVEIDFCIPVKSLSKVPGSPPDVNSEKPHVCCQISFGGIFGGAKFEISFVGPKLEKAKFWWCPFPITGPQNLVAMTHI